MVCIYCGGSTRVTNSRLQKRNNAVWRRRVCELCQTIFTTLEHTDLATAIMVRQLDSLEPFVRDKLLISIYDACKHRPKALEDAISLSQTITGDIVRQISPEGTIDRDSIVTLAHSVLLRFDPVAATVYQAFHK
jgi:transcriptional repressor NrdR